jgi:hypothetical protein
MFDRRPPPPVSTGDRLPIWFQQISHRLGGTCHIDGPHVRLHSINMAGFHLGPVLEHRFEP